MTIQQLKTKIEESLSIKIDFRSDKYIINSYGNSPIMDYDKARDILFEAWGILEIDLMSVNTYIALNRLRMYSLKQELEGYIELAK